MSEYPNVSALSHDPRRTHIYSTDTGGINHKPNRSLFTQVPKSEAGDIEGEEDMRTKGFYKLPTTGERSERVNQWYSA